MIVSVAVVCVPNVAPPVAFVNVKLIVSSGSN